LTTRGSKLARRRKRPRALETRLAAAESERDEALLAREQLEQKGARSTGLSMR
jgi:hypothetical protein